MLSDTPRKLGMLFPIDRQTLITLSLRVIKNSILSNKFQSSQSYELHCTVTFSDYSSRYQGRTPFNNPQPVNVNPFKKYFSTNSKSIWTSQIHPSDYYKKNLFDFKQAMWKKRRTRKQKIVFFSVVLVSIWSTRVSLTIDSPRQTLGDRSPISLPGFHQ